MEGFKVERDIKPLDSDRYSAWKWKMWFSEWDWCDQSDRFFPRLRKSCKYCKGNFQQFGYHAGKKKFCHSQSDLRKKLLGLKLSGDTSLVKHWIIFDKLKQTRSVTSWCNNSHDDIIATIATLFDENLTLTFVKTKLLDLEVKLRNESSCISVKLVQAEHADTQNSIENNFDYFLVI